MRAITQKYVVTDRLKMAYLHSPGSDGIPLIMVHGNASSSIFWKEVISRLPDNISAYALDLRGYGDTEDLIIDARSGMGDFTADVLSFMDALELPRAHFIGHSMGGSVLFALMGQAPERVLSACLVNPGSPYGFGGTHGLDGKPNFPDFAGSGAGVVNPEFARRIAAGDRSSDDPMASPRVVMNSFYWKPPFVPPHEEELLSGLLSQKIGNDRYPGDFTSSENYPNTAPGVFGPANALSPKYIGNSVNDFIGRSTNIPILWIRGEDDQIVSDQSLFDMGTLGKMGLIPGYPGEDVYPSQPMVGQTRAVLEKRVAMGGTYTEIVMKDTGHTPFVEREEEFCKHWFAFLQNHMGA